MYIITHLPTKTHYGSHTRRLCRTTSESHLYGFKTFTDAKYVGDHLATFMHDSNRFPKRLEMKLSLETELKDALDADLWIEHIKHPDEFARRISLQGLSLRMITVFSNNGKLSFQEEEVYDMKTSFYQIANELNKQFYHEK